MDTDVSAIRTSGTWDRASVKEPSRLISFLIAAVLAMTLAIVAPLGAGRANAATGDADTFCAGSWGTTVWTGRNPNACDGILSAYRDGTFLGKVNMPRLIASQPQPRRTATDLNRWCSSHSFWCAVAIGAFWTVIGRL